MLAPLTTVKRVHHRATGFDQVRDSDRTRNSTLMERSAPTSNRHVIVAFVSRTWVACQWTRVGPIAALFSDADHPANIAQQARMIALAGSADRVVPGHDGLQFQKFPTQGRVAKIR